MIVVAAFEAPAVVAGLDDVAMVGQAVEKRGGHLGVAEHAGPFSEGEIDGDDGRALVELADEVEQELAAGLSERQIAIRSPCAALSGRRYCSLRAYDGAAGATCHGR